MSAGRLPCAIMRYPDCGACHEELSYDGDSFYCDPCGLDYGDGNEDEQATFRDDEEGTCGAPCDDKWHGDEASEGRPTVYECNPCSLPKNHEYDHYMPCDCVMRKDAP